MTLFRDERLVPQVCADCAVRKVHTAGAVCAVACGAIGPQRRCRRGDLYTIRVFARLEDRAAVVERRSARAPAKDSRGNRERGDGTFVPSYSHSLSYPATVSCDSFFPPLSLTFTLRTKGRTRKCLHLGALPRALCWVFSASSRRPACLQHAAARNPHSIRRERHKSAPPSRPTLRPSNRTPA